MTLNYDIVNEDKARADRILWSSYLDCIIRQDWPLDATFHAESANAPNMKTVMARNREDGTHLSSVVWFENEEDNIAWISTYITEKSSRGLGIGSLVWNTAMERIPEHLNKGLMAAKAMEEKYQSNGMPHHELSEFEYQFGPDLKEGLSSIIETFPDNDELVFRDLKSLSEEQIEALIAFDSGVTGRDRSVFLRQFIGYESIAASTVLYDSSNNILGYGAMAQIPTPIPNKGEENLYRMAPLFAVSIEAASRIMLKLVDDIQRKDPTAYFYFWTVSGTIGEELLEKICAVTKPDETWGPFKGLYSKPFKNPLDKTRFFLPHSHAFHYDA